MSDRQGAGRGPQSGRVCAPVNRLSSSRDELLAVDVPNCNRVDGTEVAGAQQPFPIHLLGIHEDGDAVVIEHEGLRGFGHAVAESDAEGAVDPDAQAGNDAFVEIAHGLRGPVMTVKRPTRERRSGVSMW